MRIKRICSEALEFLRNCTKVIRRFTQRGYQESITQETYYKTTSMQRKNLFQTKEKKRSQRIPFVVTYNRTLGPIINKHWHILQSDPKMEKIVAYCRFKNLRDMIGSNTISNDKVVKPSIHFSKWKPCLSRSDCQCCKQLIKTRTFSSQITKETYDIRHNLDCKSSKVI